MTLTWIVLAGLAMSSLALVGTVSVLMPPAKLDRVLLPIVGLAAGSLLGGALFHMLPEAIDAIGNRLGVYVALVAGFLVFFALEQFLHWHHCHRADHTTHQPLGYLILLADGLHNFIGGLAVGGAFVVGALVAYAMAEHVEVAYLLPFAAGNFVYIAAADLLPEITSEERTRDKVETTGAFVAGLVILLAATQLA